MVATISAGTVFTISIDLNVRSGRLVAAKDIEVEILSIASTPGQVSVYFAENIYFFVDFADEPK